MNGLLDALTRDELDALLVEAEHAYLKSHIAVAYAPLDRPEAVTEAVGVAQDCLNLWQDVLDASIASLWAGRG